MSGWRGPVCPETALSAAKLPADLLDRFWRSHQFVRGRERPGLPWSPVRMPETIPGSAQDTTGSLVSAGKREKKRGGRPRVSTDSAGRGSSLFQLPPGSVPAGAGGRAVTIGRRSEGCFRHRLGRRPWRLLSSHSRRASSTTKPPLMARTDLMVLIGPMPPSVGAAA